MNSSSVVIVVLASFLIASSSSAQSSPRNRPNATEEAPLLEETPEEAAEKLREEETLERPPPESPAEEFSSLPPRHLHHRKSDNESSQPDAGIWQVMNQTAPHDGHSHAPSCILASMQASLVIPIQDEDGNITNKTIVVPKNASSRGQCGEKQQWLTLIWNNTHDSGKLVKTGELTLLFTKLAEEDAIYLTHVWASVALFLEDSGQSIISKSVPSQDIIMVLKEEKLLATPIRFAYICHHRLEIKLHANTLPVQAAAGDSMIVDPIYNEDAYLVFHELHVETFRHDRFGRHFTHLSYDCRNKWAYAYMPPVVGTAVTVLVVVMIIAFIFRRHLGCAPASEDPEDEEVRILVDDVDDYPDRDLAEESDTNDAENEEKKDNKNQNNVAEDYLDDDVVGLKKKATSTK